MTLFETYSIEPLLWMLVGHALAGYPLQDDWLSKAKNPTLNVVPGETIWPGALVCHAAIHAGAVAVATGSWILRACEFVAHATIDYAKCAGRLSYNADQALHVACKIVWFGLLLTIEEAA